MAHDYRLLPQMRSKIHEDSTSGSILSLSLYLSLSLSLSLAAALGS
jgi:hypothetical protein